MTSRRAIIGLCAMCALLISAVAAQGASAATTAYTCVPGQGTLNVDCVPGSSGTSGHVAIPANTRTELTGTGGETKLKATIAGTAVTLTATSAEPAPGSAPWVENVEEGGEMVAKGEGAITYTGVSANHSCGVEGLPGGAGMITTTQLKASTLGAGAGLKFTPASGTKFVEFNLTGAECPTVLKEQNPYTVNGNVTGTPKGSNVEFTHTGTTGQGTLTVKGAVAGVEGSLTLSARANSTQAYTPLSVT